MQAGAHASLQHRRPPADRVTLHRIEQRHAAASDAVGPGLNMACTSGRFLLEDEAPGADHPETLARFEPHADPALVEFLANAHEDMAFLLNLLSRSFAVVRELRAQAVELNREMGWYKQALESAGEPSTPPAADVQATSEAASATAHLSSCEDPPAGQRSASPQARKQTEPSERPSGEKKDYAAEAAMRCNDPIFVAYLVARHGLEPDSDEHFIAAAQRKALKVGSRKTLNTDPAAAARWRDMKADYEAWKQHG